MWIRETLSNSIYWQQSISIIKTLWCGYQMSLGRFTMFVVERSSETGLFRHLSNNISRVRNFLNTKVWRLSFDTKYLKFNLDFKKEAKNSEKVFCFWENYIWIGIVKLSLFRRRFFSSRANVLTSSPKIWYVNKRDFLHSTVLAVISQYDKGALMQISTVHGHVYHVVCQRLLWYGIFKTFI